MTARPRTSWGRLALAIGAGAAAIWCLTVVSGGPELLDARKKR